MDITYTVSKFHTDAAIIFITRVEKAIPMLILSGYDEGFPYYPPALRVCGGDWVLDSSVYNQRVLNAL